MYVQSHIRTHLTISVSFINPSMYMYIQVRYAMYTCMYKTCTYIQHTLVQYMYICLHVLNNYWHARKPVYFTIEMMNDPQNTVSRA